MALMPNLSESEDKYYGPLKIKYLDQEEWLMLKFLWNMPEIGGRL